MVRSVGSIGIDVQPEVTTFNEKVKKAIEKAEKNKVEIPVDVKGGSGKDGPGKQLTAIRDAIQTKVDASPAMRVKIPVTVTTQKTLSSLRTAVSKINQEIKAKGSPSIKVGVVVDDRLIGNDVRRATARVKGADVKAGLELDPDLGRIEREVHRLNRDAEMTLTPDVTLDRNQLKDLDVKLDADIEVRRDTVEDKLKRMTDLQPLVMDTDPEINTAEVRKEWERLIRDLGGHVVDLQVDVKRQKAIQALDQLHVNTRQIEDEFARLNRQHLLTLTPDVKLDRKALKELRDITIPAEIEIKRRRIEENLKRLAEIKPFVMSVDPKINTKALREEWDRLKKEISGDNVELKADLDRQTRVTAQLKNLTRNRTVQIFVNINKRSLAIAKATLTALTGFNVLRRAALMLENFVTNIDNFALATAKWSTVIAQSSTLILGMTSSLVGLGSGIAQLGGYLLLAPSLFFGLASTVGVAVLAFKGFGDGVAGTAGALEKLPPSAQKAALSLRGVFRDVQVPVQEAFWSQMAGAIEGFMRRVMPELKAGLTQLSGSFGHLGSQVLQSMAQLGESGIFSEIFGNLSKGMDEAAVGMRPFFHAFFALTAEGAKKMPDLGRAFRDMAGDFDRWVRRSIENGKVAQWIDNARQAAHDFGQAMIGIKGQFGAIVDAAKRAGTGDLHTFADTMIRIRRTMESGIFQDTLTSLFAGAHDAAKSLKEGLGDLGFALYDLAPALKSIMTISGDTLQDVFSALAAAVQKPIFKTGLVRFFEGIQKGISGLLNYLPNVAEGFGNLFDLFSVVATGTLPVVGQMFGGVADTFGQLQPILKDLVPVLTNFASNTLGIFIQALQILAVPMKVVLEFFTKLPDGVQTALLAFLLLRRFTTGPGIFGGFRKQADAVNKNLRTDIPNSAQRTRNALAKPFGPGLFSSSAFRPFIQDLRNLPGHVRGTVNGMNGQMGRLWTGPNSPTARTQQIGRNLAQYMQPGLNQMERNTQQTASRMTRAMTGFTGATSKAFKGLFNFMGGGWGVAFAVGFAVLAKAQENSRKLEDANRLVTQSYKDMATAAGEAGQGIQGIAAGESVKASLDQFREVLVSDTFLQMGEKIDLGQFIDSSGLGSQEFIDLMQGTGGEAAQAWVDGMQNALSGQQAMINSLPGPVAWVTDLIRGGDLDAAQATLKGIEDNAANAEKELSELWRTDVGRAKFIPARLKEIAEAAADGKVTVANISGIRAGIEGFDLNQLNQTAQFANGMAQIMGGTEEHMTRSVGVINTALKDWTKAGSKTGEEYGFVVRELTRQNYPIAQIKKGLEGLGLSTEESAEAIKFVWGPAVDVMGNQLTVLGEKIPKLAEFSTGINEYSDALGAAANIDSDVLKDIFTLGGIDLTAMAAQLPAAGVGLDQIHTALEATGMDAEHVGAAMAIARDEAGKLVAQTGTNLGNLHDFSLALQEMRDSADDAASKATALFTALDKLNGGVQSSGELQAGLADQIRVIQEWGKVPEEVTKAQQKWDEGLAQGLGAEEMESRRNELDNAITSARDAVNLAKVAKEAFRDDGTIDATVKGYTELNEGLKKLSTDGMAVALDAYEKDIAAGISSLDARANIQNQLGPMIDALRAFADMAGLSDDEFNTMLRTFHLTPDEIQVSVIAQTEGALADLAEVRLELGKTAQGKEIELSISNSAANQLAALGIDIKQISEGKFEIHLSTDPDTARQQLADLTKYIQEGDPTNLPVELDPQIPKDPISVPVLVPLIVDIDENQVGIQVLDELGKPITITGDLDSVKEGIQALNSAGAQITITGDIDPVIDGLQVFDQYGVKINVGADLQPAIDGIQTLDSRGATITVGADINQAVAGIQVMDAMGVEVTIGGDPTNAQNTITNLPNITGPVNLTITGTVTIAQAAIDSLRGQSIPVKVYATWGNSLSVGTLMRLHEADGGILRNGVHTFANGGENHNAQISRGLRIWGEPETGGEAYIPLALDKRNRSLEILSRVATEFGYSLTKISRRALGFADGMVTTSGTGGAGARVVINQYNPVTEKDSVALMRAGQLVAAM